MIRRIAATLMLSILMFNVGGYFLLYSVLEKRAETLMAERIINGQYAAEERVEFKLSFEMPYPVYEQRIHLEDPGRVEANNEIYSVATHEYSNNTLTLVGVRDQWAMHVDAVMSAFSASANGNSDAGMIHSLSGLFQFFVNSRTPALIESGAWERLLSPVEYPQFFAAVSLPTEPRPPSA